MSRRRTRKDIEGDEGTEMNSPRRRASSQLERMIDEKKEEIEELRDVLSFMNEASDPRAYRGYKDRLDAAEEELDMLYLSQEAYIHRPRGSTRRPQARRQSSPVRTVVSRSSRLTVESPEKRKSRRSKRKVPARDPVTGRFLPRCA